jgi:hypothetical protein
MYTRRDIEPRFDPQIQAWLLALAGPAITALVAWLKAAPLNRPSRPLFLTGAPGVGKTLLVHGIARLWEEGLGVYETALPGFGGDAPVLNLERPDSLSDLKQIASEIGVIKEKHQNPKQASGYRRVIVTQQGPELRSSGRNVVYMACRDKAAKVLFNHDQETITSWVEDNKIAAHILAL